MRFTTAIAAGLFAVAYAQTDSTTTTVDTTTIETPSTTVSLSPEQSSMMACLDACETGDVDCEADCVPVPNPSEENISSMIDCVATCPQGNGTEADNAAYASCAAGCESSFYYAATAGSGSDATATGSADGSDSTGSSDSDSDSDDADSTGSDSDSTSTDSADSSEETDSGDSGAGMVVPSAAFGLGAFLVAFAAL